MLVTRNRDHAFTALLDLLRDTPLAEVAEAVAEDPATGALPEGLTDLARQRRAVDILSRCANALQRLQKAEGVEADRRRLHLATATERAQWRRCWGFPDRGEATHPVYSPVGVMAFLGALAEPGGTTALARKRAKWRPADLKALETARNDAQDPLHAIAQWLLGWADELEAHAVGQVRERIFALMDAAQNEGVQLQAAKLAHGILDPEHTPGAQAGTSGATQVNINIQAGDLIKQVRQAETHEPLPESRPLIVLEATPEDA